MPHLTTNSSTLKIFGISLAFSLLYFIRVYRQLLYPAYDWYFEYEVPRLEILTTLFCSLVVFCVFSALLLLIRDTHFDPRKRNLQILFIVLALLSFGPLSGELLDWWFLDYEPWFKYALPVLVLAICLLPQLRGKGRLSRATANLSAAAFFIFPIAILTFGHALLLATGVVNKDLEPNSIETRLETPESDRRLPRVVWIIFDELDFSAMEQKPSDINLPAFDELVSNSFVAENAFSPNVSTSVSLPALLTGKKVYWVEPHGPDKLTLNFSDQPSVELSITDTVFDDVVALNGNAAVAGWNHPYPRLFPGTLAFGYWAPRSIYRCREFGECIVSALGNSLEDMPVVRDLFKANPLLNLSEIKFIRKPFLTYREHVDYSLFLRDHAENLVMNESVDLVFLHLVAPHFPFVKRNNEPAANYFEALESADETLSILRAAMKSHDLWDRTTVIVSSDHWMRSDFSDLLKEKEEFMLEETRIPFIVKPAKGGKPLQYHPRFNTLITRYLIKAILTGEVRTAKEIAAWLDQAAKDQPELVSFHPCHGIENLNAAESNSSSNPLLTCK